MTLHDAEDRLWWCAPGQELESFFLENIVPLLKDDIILNPEKKTNPMVPRLLYHSSLADLKTVSTPFFKSQVIYNMPPQWTVMFDVKDHEEYNEFYPKIEIFFWVKWKETEWQDNNDTKFSIEPAEGVWQANLSEINEWVKSGSPRHSYIKHQKDDVGGNTKDCFCFDLRKMKLRWLKGNKESLYCINFPDGSYINVVQNHPSLGETDEATINHVKNMIAAFPGTKVVGSISEIK